LLFGANHLNRKSPRRGILSIAHALVTDLARTQVTHAPVESYKLKVFIETLTAFLLNDVELQWVEEFENCFDVVKRRA